MEKISKNQLKKIGDRIRKDAATLEDYRAISELRSSHVPLVKILRDTVQNHKDPKRFISRRIKRMPSIINKLKRFKDMDFGRMQDIGGVRIVISGDISEVYELSDKLKTRTYKKGNKNSFSFEKEYDYIKFPKEDGYRSVHHIYRYQGKKYSELVGLKVELQIRTEKQHQWATAVEVLDMILNTSLKIGIADEQYRKFFKLSSQVIEYVEEKHKDPLDYKRGDIKEIVQEIDGLDKTYKIFDKLLSVAAVNTYKDKLFNESDYLVLTLKIEERVMNIKKIADKELAEVYYRDLEARYRDDPKIDIVMVSTDNLKTLKKAYPNYFLDAKDFVSTIRKVINKLK